MMTYFVGPMAAGASLAFAFTAVFFENTNDINADFNDLERATIKTGVISREFNCGQLLDLQKMLNTAYVNSAAKGSNPPQFDFSVEDCVAMTRIAAPAPK